MTNSVVWVRAAPREQRTGQLFSPLVAQAWGWYGHFTCFHSDAGCCWWIPVVEKARPKMEEGKNPNYKADRSRGQQATARGVREGVLHVPTRMVLHIHWHIWHWGQSCLSAIWRATLLWVSKGWSASAAKTISLEHLPVFISCQIKQMDLVSKPADKTLKVLLCFSSLLWAPLQS